MENIEQRNWGLHCSLHIINLRKKGFYKVADLHLFLTRLFVLKPKVKTKRLFKILEKSWIC